MFGADIGIVLAYSAGIMLIFMLSWILVIPFKIVGKFVLNALIGGALIILFNFFGKLTGVNIGVNEITALIVGLLGVPGFIAILAIKLIL
nr:pro-sigmaK processing inhibitor BofA family protein [Sedimentibacter sp.]